MNWSLSLFTSLNNLFYLVSKSLCFIISLPVLMLPGVRWDTGPEVAVAEMSPLGRSSRWFSNWGTGAAQAPQCHLWFTDQAEMWGYLNIWLPPISSPCARLFAGQGELTATSLDRWVMKCIVQGCSFTQRCSSVAQQDTTWVFSLFQWVIPVWMCTMCVRSNFPRYVKKVMQRRVELNFLLLCVFWHFPS